MARHRLLVRILPAYDHLSICQGFLFEKEPVFSYKSSTFPDDLETGLRVLSYMERVFRVFVSLLLALYS